MQEYVKRNYLWIVFLIGLTFAFIGLYAANELAMINAQRNCDVLIKSERILMEDNPEFDWRSDAYFLKMWDSLKYQCDLFYDIEETMGSWDRIQRYE